jgi:hypothetical protein
MICEEGKITAPRVFKGCSEGWAGAQRFPPAATGVGMNFICGDGIVYFDGGKHVITDQHWDGSRWSDKQWNRQTVWDAEANTGSVPTCFPATAHRERIANTKIAKIISVLVNRLCYSPFTATEEILSIPLVLTRDNPRLPHQQQRASKSQPNDLSRLVGGSLME